MTYEQDTRRGRTLDYVASVAGPIGIAAAIVAGATIWVVLTEPVTVAKAVGTGEIFPLVHRLAEIIYRAMTALLDYL